MMILVVILVAILVAILVWWQRWSLTLAREDVGKALAQTARAAGDDRPSAVRLRVPHLPAQLGLQHLDNLHARR